jgi:hypothetical protein
VAAVHRGLHRVGEQLGDGIGDRALVDDDPGQVSATETAIETRLRPASSATAAAARATS